VGFATPKGDTDGKNIHDSARGSCPGAARAARQRTPPHREGYRAGEENRPAGDANRGVLPHIGARKGNRTQLGTTGKQV